MLDQLVPFLAERAPTASDENIFSARAVTTEGASLYEPARGRLMLARRRQQERATAGKWRAPGMFRAWLSGEVSQMDVQIETSKGVATFALDEHHGFWRCAHELPEGDFPLIQIVKGKRYELYSDGTLAEVELKPTEASRSSKSRE